MPHETTLRTELERTKPRLDIKACVSGHRGAIAPVVEGLMEAMRDAGCATGREFEIELALQEALANAAVHGCGNDPSKLIECSLSSDESGELTIVVRDPGPGFDPGSVPDPLAGKNIYATHGRGIYLLRQLIDEVWFERGGSEIHMVLKPPGLSTTHGQRGWTPGLRGRGDRAARLGPSAPEG
jgi:serine/threonine-protein kinase RsbW